ncbi:MAG TPA: hypothetical protein VMT66_10210 [Steroidobacteraceae bacterium]|nr:hypothetical protein [Steroidobacteraceae bacterium]
MIAAKHFFAYLGSGEPDPQRLTQLAAAFRKMGYRTLERPSLLGFIPFGAEASPLPEESAILQVMTGTELRLRTELARSADLESARELAAEQARIFNLLCYTRDAVTIASDPLGVLPYYTARWGEGTLVCSSLWHLFACADVRQRRF